MSVASNDTFEAYLLLHNVGKKQNFGQLVRSALAFGVKEIGVVGCRRISEVSLFGNQGTGSHAEFRFFDKLHQAKKYYNDREIDLCGIEIGDDSKVVFDRTKTGSDAWPFKRSTCFMLGNEGFGMTEKQLELSDLVVYIPQHSKATASLNVLVAGSIVLHHFSLFAGTKETEMEGHKFVTEAPRGKLERFANPTEEELAEIEQKRAERELKKQRTNPEEAAKNDEKVSKKQRLMEEETTDNS